MDDGGVTLFASNFDELVSFSAINGELKAFLQNHGAEITISESVHIDFPRGMKAGISDVVFGSRNWEYANLSKHDDDLCGIIPACNGILFVSVYSTMASIRSLTKVRGDLRDEVADLERAIHKVCPSGQAVPVYAAYTNSNGGICHFQARIECPPWESVRDNYASGVQQKTDELISTDIDGAGRLIIWFGLPGSGKTWAVRSLLSEWRDKYQGVIILDSDRFMESPAYYYSLMEDLGEEKPLLFIMEDSADGLLEESRAFKGSQVAGILNMTDGLLTQGRKDLFLVTFNEQVKELDRAVVRPGRCLTQIEYVSLPAEQSQQWLKNHDSERFGDVSLDKEHTIAELYQLLRGDEHHGKETLGDAIGFNGDDD